jgi:UDP-2-acetamido-3-amino-2,3-dideoxy-glucuronate N-acetyltransferase
MSSRSKRKAEAQNGFESRYELGGGFSRLNEHFVHESCYIDDDVEIGEDTKVWHFCHIQKGAKIGKHCVLGQNVNIGPGVVIGNGVKIQNNVSVYEGIEVGDKVFIGPSVVFTNVTMPRASFKSEFKKTIIQYGATIGANSTILCGITIHNHAFIGAGSVVTKDVGPFDLVYGVPAKVHGTVNADGEKNASDS